MALQRVETDAIQDDAVTTAKIAANAVAAADIAADAITNVKVAAGAAIAVSKITGLGTAATLTAGTAANNVVQLDGSARLPAISGANLTGVSTDTSAMENNIVILAFKTQSANNLAKFNLIDQVIDEYKDGTGATYSSVSQLGSTATDGYLATIYSSSTELAYSVGTQIGNLDGSAGNAFDGNEAVNATSSGGVDPTTGGKDWGVGNTKKIDRFWLNNTASQGFNFGGSTTTIKLQGSTDNFSSSTVDLYTTGSISDAPNSYVEVTSGITTTTAYRYHRLHLSPIVTDSRIAEIKFWELVSSTAATGTATSTANTALTAPTTGDICMLIENFAGAATLNTDLKAYVSRNGGTGWDQVTLADKGSWGTNKKIVTANNVAFSNSASGTDMRYKIEWANQASGTKETRVHATSLAWA